MSRRAFAAVVRLELLRGRVLLLWGSAGAAVVLVATLLLPTSTALLMALFAAPFTILLATAPAGGVALDKLHGHLEFDRSLPLPLMLLAAGRLVGAAIRTLPTTLGVMALGLAIVESARSAAGVAVVAAVAVVVQLLVWCLVWVLMALNARFSLRRLWWVPMTLWMGPALLPESMMARVGDALRPIGNTLLEQLASPGRFALVAVAVLLVPTLLIFAGSTALFAGGLARFRPNPSALGVPLGTAPRRELSALGRGAALAVMRLRLRLALEQLRRELVIIVVILVVIVVDVGELAGLARVYLPVLAALIPGGVALHLASSRATGALEGLQHLPVPHRVIALGHLLAVMLLAVPGVAVMAVAEMAQGNAVVALSIVGRWLWYAAFAWLGAAAAVWVTRRRMVGVAGVIAVAVLLWWAPWTGADFTDRALEAWSQLSAIRGELGLYLPLAVAVVAVPVGVRLFAWGLRTNEGMGR